MIEYRRADSRSDSRGAGVSDTFGADSRMRSSPDGQNLQIPGGIAPNPTAMTQITSDTPAGREFPPILLLDEEVDPGIVVLTCANCGAAMDERKCKLICRCGYFLSCSDYY